MKKGFSLIETLIGIFIFSLLMSTLVFTGFKVFKINEEITSKEKQLYETTKMIKELEETFDDYHIIDCHMEDGVIYFSKWGTILEIYYDNYIVYLNKRYEVKVKDVYFEERFVILNITAGDREIKLHLKGEVKFL